MSARFLITALLLLLPVLAQAGVCPETCSSPGTTLGTPTPTCETSSGSVSENCPVYVSFSLDAGSTYEFTLCPTRCAGAGSTDPNALFSLRLYDSGCAPVSAADVICETAVDDAIVAPPQPTLSFTPTSSGIYIVEIEVSEIPGLVAGSVRPPGGMPLIATFDLGYSLTCPVVPPLALAPLTAEVDPDTCSRQVTFTINASLPWSYEFRVFSDLDSNPSDAVLFDSNNDGLIEFVTNLSSPVPIGATGEIAVIQVMVRGDCVGSIQSGGSTIIGTENFVFTLEDNTPPDILCPTDITVLADPESPSAIVNYTASATDACTGMTSPSLVSGAPSGAPFPIGTTEVTLDATDFAGNVAVCSFDVTVTAPAGQRVEDCLVALYRFDEGSGSTVNDVSGESPPIDLTIDDPSAVAWLPDNGLRVDGAAMISSNGPVTRIIDACTLSNEVTLEAWVRSASLDQSGPARVVALSQNGSPNGGNALLMQNFSDYTARLRTTETDQYGRPNFDADGVVDPAEIQHVVFTRSTSGDLKIYVDGTLASTSSRDGSLFGSWGNYDLGLANEPNPDSSGNGRPWFGDLHLVAIYKKALDATEITQNFEAGHGANPPAPTGPMVTLQPSNQSVFEGQTATFRVEATGTAPLSYQWQTSGAFTTGTWLDLSGANEATLEVPNTSPLDNGRQFRCEISNLIGTVTSDPATLLVEAAAPPSLTLDVTPSTQTIASGQELRLTYSVTNTGGVPLQNITFPGSPALCADLVLVGGDDGDGILQPGGVFVYSCSGLFPTASFSDVAAVAADTLGGMSLGAPAVPVVVTVLDQTLRVTDCQLAVYDFFADLDDPRPTTVDDVSGVAPLLPLTVQDPDAVTWLAGGGLRIDSPTTISSLVPADKINDACRASNEITIEAWIRPTDATQNGPARIVALSGNGSPLGGNALLVQNSNEYGARLRTSDTDQYGRPQVTTAADPASTEGMQHVVYTRSSDGSERIYVNNVLLRTDDRDGSFTPSWDDFRLALGNEPLPDANGNGRPWEGEFYLVALFKKALSAAEVEQNYLAGPIVSDPPELGPSILAQPRDLDVLEGDPATFTLVATGVGALQYQWEELLGDWTTVPMATDSSYSLPRTIAADDGRIFRCVVTDDDDSITSSPATLAVTTTTPPGLTLTADPLDAFVTPGATLSVIFNLVNTGDEPLANVSIDAPCGIVSAGGDTNNNAMLDLTEVWFFQCSFGSVVADQSYTACVTANALSGPVNDCVAGTITIVTGERVTQGLLALYPLQEAGGTTVFDESGVFPPLDLEIRNPANVSRLPGGGVSIQDETRIVSESPAGKINDRCRATREITIEAWLRVANSNQSGPARIVALSDNGFDAGGNAILGQQNQAFAARLRTTQTNQYGKPEVRTPISSFTTEMVQVVYTRSSTGTTSLYLDGVLASTGTTVGTFSNWGEYELCLGNEPNDDLNGNGRPWLGEIFLVAIYENALNATEVLQNYNAGANPTN